VTRQFDDRPTVTRHTARVSAAAFCALLILWAAPSPAQSVIGDRPVAGRVRIQYVPPKATEHRTLFERLKEARALEQMQEMLSPLRLPRLLRLKLSECDGVANAWYEDNEVTVCYELLAEYVKNAPTGSLPAGLEQRDTIVGPFLDVFLHEAGHAIFDLLGIPILGREEDAADQFSTILMLRFDKARARRLILGSAYQYRLDVKDAAVALETKAFSDEHGLPAQRFFNVLCIAYGADPKLFADVVEKGYLPKERAERCEEEYRQVEYAFTKLIAPHLDRFRAAKVRRKLMRAPAAR
jgi:hypothetical protein